jgi:putative transposase
VLGKIKSKEEEDTTPEVRAMEEGYRRSSHAIYALKYHLVWITKYRKRVLGGKVGVRTRELIRQVCKENEVEILSGHVATEHIHLLVSVPPSLSVSKLVQYIKGYTSRKLLMENKELNKQFWGRHLWGRGYFAASSGNVTDDIIKHYIENQELEENQRTDNFSVSDPEKL